MQHQNFLDQQNVSYTDHKHILFYHCGSVSPQSDGNPYGNLNFTGKENGKYIQSFSIFLSDVVENIYEVIIIKLDVFAPVRCYVDMIIIVVIDIDAVIDVYYLYTFLGFLLCLQCSLKK